MSVVLDRVADIGVITIDNPPVNATSHAVRAGLAEALRALAADPTLKAAVLRCAGRTFVAGADLKEFGEPSKPPTLPEVVAMIERSAKPIVAAIHGTALGGGLELALACQGRIASEDAALGFPEVHVGVIPGAGGTQRLPRLIGLAPAIDLITSGRRVKAHEALDLRLIDVIADRELTEHAIDMARGLADGTLPPHRAHDHPVDAGGFDWDGATEAVRKAARGLQAPLRALDAIELATEMSLTKGLERERTIFEACRDSLEGRAMRHAFLAERAAAGGGETGAEARPLTTAGVVGAGTMGRGIALCFAAAGVPVTLVDSTAAVLAKAEAAVAALIDGDAAKGRIDGRTARSRKALVSTANDLSALAGCDLVVEAVFEDMAVKQDLFRSLGAAAKAGTTLASNTSYLDVAGLGAASGRARDVIGLHFFSPAHIMKLVEVVTPPDAGADAIATGFAAARRLGKIPVRAGNAHGFIGNRIWSAYRREAEYRLEGGALPMDVDEAMVGFGFRMGPFAVHDLAGLDVGSGVRQAWREAHPGRRYVDLADRLCAMGRTGQKSGAGWYRYEPGDRTPHPDPVVAELVRDRWNERDSGISRAGSSQQEIVHRIMTAMVNEGCHVLAEDVARCPADIDVVMLNGYGFPRALGGPMFWADEIGIATLADWLDTYAAQDPTAWEPSPLLRGLAQSGGSFTAMNRA